MKVIHWATLPLARNEIAAAVSALPGVQLAVVSGSAELEAAFPEADGLIAANPTPADGAVLARLLQGRHRLRWLHLISAGMDGVGHCGLPPQIEVSCTPGATAQAVSDHALALLFALLRGLPAAWELQRARRWDRARVAPRVTSIEDKTVVLLGYGAIGRHLHRVFDALGARVRIVSRSLPQAAGGAPAYRLAQLGQALTGADVLVCAIALSESTEGLVDEAALRCMNARGFLVNVARGTVVRRAALERCLCDGHLGGAGLDVTDPEPLADDDTLWSLPNLIVTPHYGGAGSPHAARRIAEAAAAAVRRRLPGAS